MKLPELPAEILIIVYLQLIDETDLFVTSVRSFAGTCRWCWGIFDETRLIWIYIFAALCVQTYLWTAALTIDPS